MSDLVDAVREILSSPHLDELLEMAGCRPTRLGRALELGFRDVSTSFWAARGGMTYLGVSDDPDLVSESEDKHCRRGIGFVCASPERVLEATPKASVDLVLAFGYLQWCRNPLHVIEKARQVLHPRGAFLATLVVDSADSDQTWIRVLRPTASFFYVGKVYGHRVLKWMSSVTIDDLSQDDSRMEWEDDYE